MSTQLVLWLAESLLLELLEGILSIVASGLGTGSDGDTHVIIRAAAHLCILDGIDG